MSIWFFLWLFLSGALMYFLGWTLYILYRQKTTWQAYATKNKMRYKSETLLASPEMSGSIENYSVSFLIAEHMSPDARSSRKLTAIEVKLLSKMPFAGVIASGGMVPLAQSLGLKEELRPENPKWDKNYIAASTSRMALEVYLTPEKLEALLSLMKIRNGWVILIFRGDTLLLRFDTPDPLDSHEKLNKIVRKMLDIAVLLELKTGESAVLKSEAAKAPIKSVNVALEDKDFDDAKSFQLEEDAVPPPPSAPPSSEEEKS